MLPESSAAFYAQQQQISALTTATANKLWQQMGPNFDQSWATIRPQMIATLTAGQLATANQAAGYVDNVLAETGDDGGDAVGTLDPAAFTGTASDGRDLGTLLDYAPITAKQAVGQGQSVPSALAEANRWLSLATLTQIADTRREYVAADIGRHPRLGGYVRMLNPPSCYRCMLLSGKWYRWNQGFQRHPRCLPAGAVISGPEVEAATRRWFEGELVILHTASGQRLPITGNHPVLTDQGWVPANLITEGARVIRSTLGQGATPLVVPHEQHRPTLVEDVWRSSSVAGFDRVPTTAEDFHGDGMLGEVDVVLADRLLDGHGPAAFRQPDEHLAFAFGLESSGLLAADRDRDLLRVRQGNASYGGVGGLGLLAPFFGGHLGRAHSSGARMAADRHTRLDQMASYHVARGRQSVGDAVFGLAVEVGERHFGDVEVNVSARWDAATLPFTVEGRRAYADRGQDLRLRLASQVELDGVVKVERTEFRGHVYNVSSSEGWYSANGIICMNCDCVHIPVSENRAGDFRTDPYAYFKSLTADAQVALVGKSEARAINDGADIYRVLNLKDRGLSVAGSRQAIKYGTPTRVTVDQIYRTAGTRANAIRLMQEHGYITGEQKVGGVVRGRVEGFGQLGKGGRARAASDAVLAARQSGVRDPLNRYTMTAAERRLYDAKVRLDAAERQGIWLQSVDANSADKFNRPQPITPGQLAVLRRNYATQVRTAKTGPASVQRLAGLLGIAL